MSAPPLAAAPAREASAPLAATGLAAAGRAVPVAVLAALPGLVFAAGFDHLAYGLGLLAGVVLAGLLVAPHVARLGAATLTDAVRQRFGGAVAMLAAGVVVLVAGALLTAELSVAGVVAASIGGVPPWAAVMTALALAIGAAVALDARAFAALAVVAFLLLAAALVVPLVLMAWTAHGPALPHVAFGEALTAVAALEERLLESGGVDFDTFSAHVSPFLRLAPLDLTALVVALALGTGVLPPLIEALAAPGRADRTRLAGAWTALCLMAVLISVPPLAAYAKLAILTDLARAAPLSAPPAWLEAPLAAGLAHIHGTSPALLAEVARATAAGATDPAAVAGQLSDAPGWLALDDSVRAALFDAARALGPGAAAPDIWQAYLGRVLPAAAAAAGNEAATLTQAALVLEPVGLLLALPALAAGPGWLAALIAAGMLAAGIVMAAALLRSLMALAPGPPDLSTQPRKAAALALAVGTGVIAAALAVLRPPEPTTLAVAALSLAAAGLFPVLAIGLSWRRATAAGAAAAILAGAAMTLYYEAGTELFPAAFYETWPSLSNAGEYAVEEYATLKEAYEAAGDDAAKAEAAAALDAFARGTPARPGLANWLGIAAPASAIFGVPAGLAALVLISLLTARRPSRARQGA